MRCVQIDLLTHSLTHSPGNTAVVICLVDLSVSVCVCFFVISNALTSEGLEIESSLFGKRYVFRISRSSSYVKVIGSRSRSQKQNSVSPCPVYSGLPSTEKQCCCLFNLHHFVTKE